jgi:NIMA (never in mitosis gene a)-related kinase
MLFACLCINLINPLNIGEGAYSSVYHVRRHLDKEIYALKKVKMGKLSDKEKDNALNEVRILASI